MLFIIISIFYTSYLIFLFFILLGWEKLKSNGLSELTEFPYISVIIPVKNEEKHINKLISDFINQKYPNEKFELIFINDNSSDKTEREITKYLDDTPIRITLINNILTDHPLSSKKVALTKGVENSKGEIICFTDGDTERGPSFLLSYAKAFQNSKIQFASGPVFYTSDTSLYEEISGIEFSSLMATGAASIYWGQPVMCNGANIGFRKEAFYTVNGYHGTESIVSGDDIILLKRIKSHYPDGILFIKSKDAVVFTHPAASLKELFNQRIRWAGKWKMLHSLSIEIMALYIFFTHLVIIFSILCAFFQCIEPALVLLFIMTKILIEYYIFKRVFQFAEKPLKIFPFIISSLLYSIYAITFGILANVLSYTWKGKTYYK